MNEEEVEELFSLMSQAIEMRKSLDAFWREIDLSSVNIEREMGFEKLVPSLKKTIVSRIEILNSFELLTRISPEDSLRVLKSRYLGKGVSGDRKFGGYQFELETMLDDIVEICGEGYLRKILDDEDFDQNKLGDSRVIDSFCEALSLESKEEFYAWKNERR